MLKNVKIKKMDTKTLKKILFKRGFLSFRKSTIKKQSSLENLYKISFSSLLIISFFYILPTSYNFVSKAFKPNLEVQNSSNKQLTQA